MLEGKGVGTVVKQLARIGAKKLKSKKVKRAVYKAAKKVGSAGLEGAVSGAEERAREAGHDTARNVGKKKETKEGFEVQEKVLDKFETGEKERIVKGMKKDSKGLKKRYGDKWKNVMYATATKRAKEAGDTSKSDERYAHEGYQRDPEQSKKDRTHSKQPDPSKDGFTGDRKSVV